MSFAEKPPILSGNDRQDIANLRDYLFRMAGSLNTLTGADSKNLTVSYQNGRQVVKEAGAASADIDAIRRNAQELKSLIIKTAGDLSDEEIARAEGDASVISYTDSKKEVYDGLYLAQSVFGTFQQNLTTTITTTAQGVVESYNYDSQITGISDDLEELQKYNERNEGQIQRGIVLDPTTNQYVTGIAISQDLQFTGVVCDKDDPNNPGDGHVYYYMETGQTFGLYTSTGWQFWINGRRKGWYNSQMETLYVENLQTADKINVGGTWQMRSNGAELEITYVGN